MSETVEATVTTEAPAAPRRRRTVAAAVRATEVPEVSPGPSKEVTTTPKVSPEVKAANKALVPIAKEITVRLDKAAKLESDAQDHRVAAAIKMAEAKEICTRAGVSFKDWAAENFPEVGYQAVRKLANLGEKDNPEQAVEEARAAQAERAKASRDRKAAEAKNTDPAAGPFEPLAPEPGLYTPAPKVDAKAVRQRILSAWETLIDPEDEQDCLLDMVEMLADNQKRDLLTALADLLGATVDFSNADKS